MQQILHLTYIEQKYGNENITLVRDTHSNKKESCTAVQHCADTILNPLTEIKNVLEKEVLEEISEAWQWISPKCKMHVNNCKAKPRKPSEHAIKCFFESLAKLSTLSIYSDSLFGPCTFKDSILSGHKAQKWSKS